MFDDNLVRLGGNVNKIKNKQPQQVTHWTDSRGWREDLLFCVHKV